MFQIKDFANVKIQIKYEQVQANELEWKRGRDV